MPDIVIPLHRNLGAALGVAPDMNGPREIVEPRIYVAGKAPVQQAMIDVLEALGHEGAIAVPRAAVRPDGRRRRGGDWAVSC